MPKILVQEFFNHVVYLNPLKQQSSVLFIEQEIDGNYQDFLISKANEKKLELELYSLTENNQDSNQILFTFKFANQKKTAELLYTGIVFNLPTYSTCQECGLQNEYLPYQPKYICYNCRN